MNRVIRAVERKALELGYTVVEQTSRVVLAKRGFDGKFATWGFVIRSNKAEFFEGHYGMDFKSATEDFNQ